MKLPELPKLPKPKEVEAREEIKREFAKQVKKGGE